MAIRKLFIFMTLVLLMCSPCLAEEKKAEPKIQAEEFLGFIISGESDKGFDIIFSGTSMEKHKKQQLELIKNQTKSGLPLYGKLIGKEFISEKTYGSRVVKLTYFLYSDLAPITWVFHFYKVDKSWLLYNIVFNDQVQTMDL